ncbi:MAG: hypothetical protein H6662_05765 [Ardenticatenaceae bacterium]|nr:hypothetical protein [Ardenticatenaceae bacterium]MCB8991165.1 hypothetical protein [Ardenticatenaceae bacterium]MCB9005373.1 hypothetical protein [Ardenticatenaceae bacterium]
MNLPAWGKILYRKQISDNRSTAVPWQVAVLLALLFGVVVVRTAWLNDDAYITFRVVDNFLHGYGLTWNPGERVQVSTHPLWLGLLILAQLVSGELYYSSLALSIVLSVFGLFWLNWRMAKGVGTAVLATLTLTLAKSYMDYATSGLENPLSHLLIILFFYYYWANGRENGRQSLLPLTLLLALAMLTRTDLLLLLAPPLALTYLAPKKFTIHHFLRPLLLGLTPLIAWELFSLIYYGFPFPNTAYAKAFNTGIPAADLARQGWLYLRNSWHWDPLTLTVTAVALLRALTTRQLKPLAAAAGILLYLAYVVKIGGDFMSGRFLAAPLLTAVLILIQHPPHFVQRWWEVMGVVTAVTWLGWQANYPTLLSGPDYGAQPAYETNSRDEDIADERIFYYPNTGLTGPHLPQPWIEQAKIARSESQPFVERGNIGFFGYFVGPQTYILDHYALSDALLARLPVDNPADWRVGHLRRTPPPGYVETLQSGQNQLADPQLAAYYDHLHLIIRGPLWTWPRLQTIWRTNTGQYDYLLKK